VGSTGGPATNKTAEVGNEEEHKGLTNIQCPALVIEQERDCLLEGWTRYVAQGKLKIE
jgi:hypothetical protein